MSTQQQDNRTERITCIQENDAQENKRAQENLSNGLYNHSDNRHHNRHIKAE